MHEDFQDLHDLLMAAGGHHPGMLVVRFDSDPRNNMTDRGSRPRSPSSNHRAFPSPITFTCSTTGHQHPARPNVAATRLRTFDHPSLSSSTASFSKWARRRRRQTPASFMRKGRPEPSRSLPARGGPNRRSPGRKHLDRDRRAAGPVRRGIHRTGRAAATRNPRLLFRFSGVVPVAVRRAAVPGVVVPATAPDHPVRGLGRPPRAIVRPGSASANSPSSPPA